MPTYLVKFFVVIYIIGAAGLLLLLHPRANQSLSAVFAKFPESKGYRLLLIILLLNLAGVPPLPGFFIKVKILQFILIKTNYWVVSIITIINFYIFYFYIKNIKFSFNKLVISSNIPGVWGWGAAALIWFYTTFILYIEWYQPILMVTS